jgi:spermidine/putrescine transport system substrate-binding protein
MPSEAGFARVAESLGIELAVSRVSSNEDLEEAMLSDCFDLVCPSDYLVERLVRQGRLVELDRSALPAISSLAAWCFDQSYDLGCAHTVPLAFGTTGFLVWTDCWSGRSSWDPLLRPSGGHEVGMLGEPREVVGAALKACGFSLNDTSEWALNEAQLLLLGQQSSVVSYSSEDFISPLVARRVVVQHAWSSPGYLASEANPRIRYVVPAEGATLWVTTAAIPISSTRMEEGHAVLNALLEPGIAAITAVSSGFATPNEDARSRLPARMRDNLTLYPDEDILARCEVMHDLAKDEATMTAVWSSLMVPFLKRSAQSVRANPSDVGANRTR